MTARQRDALQDLPLGFRPPSSTTPKAGSPNMTARQRQALQDLPLSFRPPAAGPSIPTSHRGYDPYGSAAAPGLSQRVRALAAKASAPSDLPQPAQPAAHRPEPGLETSSPSEVLEVSLEREPRDAAAETLMEVLECRPVWKKIGTGKTSQIQASREINLVGAARQKEIDARNVSRALESHLEQAMGKEWSKWQEFGATKQITSQRVRELVNKGHKIIGTRWVLTEKDDPSARVKARLVVQGCQEIIAGMRTDAPTGSRESYILVVCSACIPNWRLRAFDAQTAYLQSEGIDRVLLLRMPRDRPPPGTQPGEVRLATGSIYGTKDAARAWYRHSKRVLAQHGFVESSLERGLYFHYTGGEVDVILHSHVDDFLVAQAPTKAAEKVMQDLTPALHLKESAAPFTYCGKRFEIHPDKIVVTQTTSALALETIGVPRGVSPESAIDEDTRSGFRSLLGQLLWLSLNTRFDIAGAVSLCAQKTCSATWSDVKSLNNVSKYTRNTASLGVTYRRNVVDIRKCVLVGFGDSSFANAEGEKSQCGQILIGVMEKDIPKVIDGDYTLALPLLLQSSTIKRVVRSTLVAEGYATSEIVESGIYFRNVVEEAFGKPGRSPGMIERDAKRRKVLILTDSNSLDDSVHNDKGVPSDKRFRIVVAALRQTFMPADGENCLLKWCNTHQMLADGLTKYAVAGSAVGSTAVAALLRGARHVVPTGRLGRAAAVAATLASKVRGAGATEAIVAFQEPLALGTLIEHVPPSAIAVIACLLAYIWGHVILEGAARKVRRFATRTLQWFLRALLWIIDDDESTARGLAPLPGDATGFAPASLPGAPTSLEPAAPEIAVVERVLEPEPERSPLPGTRGMPRTCEAKTQTVVTYTSLRRHAQPRFEFSASHGGVWRSDAFVPGSQGS